MSFDFCLTKYERTQFCLASTCDWLENHDALHVVSSATRWASYRGPLSWPKWCGVMSCRWMSDSWLFWYIKVRGASQEIIRCHQASESSACSVGFLCPMPASDLPPRITGLSVFSYNSLPAFNLMVSLCRVWVIVWKLNSWLSVVYGACLCWSQGPYTIWDSRLKRISTSNLTKSRLPITYDSVTQSFFNLCTEHGSIIALSKPSKWLDNWNRCYGRKRFREIWF